MTAHAYTPAEVERIARTLGGARKNGGGWDCRCPAHDDQEPSLSLSVGEDGRLLWCCHTGCDQAAVLDGLKKRGVLMNGDAREAEPKAGKGRIVATYDYTDENGGLLFQAVRYQPKRFKQRRPDGARRLGMEPRGRPPRPLPPARGAGGRGGADRRGREGRRPAAGAGLRRDHQPAGRRQVAARVRRGAGRQARGRPARQRRGRPQARRQGGRQPAGQGREREGARAAGPAREGRRLATGSTPATPPTSCAG